ncbi:MAG TPA: CPBP family intramembrane glutamic endopeptidase, partial [Thermomicrobiales bacterium]|nr:CPBP family intramembrane glutamic endopeptidase [Thermomicrobiales bacterium]
MASADLSADARPDGPVVWADARNGNDSAAAAHLAAGGADVVALFFIPALTEEAGWSGYVIDPLQSRWSALSAAMVVGLVWAVWHAVPYLQAG